MTDDGSNSWFSIIWKLAWIIILTLLPSIGVFHLLLYVPWMPSQWVGPTLLLSGIVFLVGAGILVTSKNIRNWFYSILVGYVIGFGCIVYATLAMLSHIPVPIFGNAMNVVILAAPLIIFVILASSPWTADTAQPKLVTTSSKSITSQKLAKHVPIFHQKLEKVKAIELKEIPHDYAFAEDKRHNLSEMIERFHTIVRSLTSIPWAFRIQRFEWTTDILFLTWARDDGQLEYQKTVLYDALCNNLPGFQFQYSNSIKSKIKSLESRYRKESAKSETVISKERPSFFRQNEQESKTIVDLAAKRKAEILQRRIERLSNQHLYKTTVTALSWDRDITKADINAHRLASTLIGALRPDNEQDEFRVEYKNKRKDANRLLRGFPVGNSSLLTTDEATNYCILPRTLDVKTTKRAKFSTASEPVPNQPQKSKSRRNVVLGHPIRNNEVDTFSQLLK